jgi:hypothetical protein
MFIYGINIYLEVFEDFLNSDLFDLKASISYFTFFKSS